MTDLLVTKEGIRVEVGQVWRDLDRRQLGYRTGRVCDVDAESGRARVQSIVKLTGEEYGNQTWVSVRRMHKHSTGWELVK